MKYEFDPKSFLYIILTLRNIKKKKNPQGLSAIEHNLRGMNPFKNPQTCSFEIENKIRACRSTYWRVYVDMKSLKRVPVFVLFTFSIK